MISKEYKTYINRIQAFLDWDIDSNDMVQMCQTALELNQMPALPPPFHVAILHCCNNGLVHFNGRALQ